MSKKQQYTDEELRRILEESDYENNSEPNSSNEDDSATEEEHSDVPDFGDDDSVADPDFVPSELSVEPLDVSELNDIQINRNENINIQRSPSHSTSIQDGDIFDDQHSPSHSISIQGGNISETTPINSNRDREITTGPRIGIRPTTESQMKEHDQEEGWNYEIQPLGRQSFSSETNFIHIENIPENADVYTVFRLLVDDSVIDLMIEQTNIYAEQLIAVNPGGRMNRWKPVNKEDMEKFLGIYLVTGIIKFPTLECYWKKDPIFYHPLMHNIQMSYNRFVTILRCWHFVDNTAERDANDRLYKVKPVIDIVMNNCRKLLSPNDCVVVDESMVPFQGRLLIRQYNPNKTHKYGLKIYKATTDDGYVWKYKVYTGQDPQISNLDKPGSVVVELCEDLLDTGRMIIGIQVYR
ncbi:unnamed protein product [Danaus chrysippus]|uniref:(African queen) hypothetical protein n=1 Tax=Danaus chrysippus TaxID=151541 RepID=A0A8J2W0X3_9NEOP|nr:unnamed protein product [Danaus chrysippus]